MLKNIRLHVDADEEKQTQLEAAVSPLIQQNHRESINAFQRYIPNLVENIRELANSHVTVFCNANQQLNIVDYNAGRVLYGQDPKAEINAQFERLANYADKVDLLSGQASQEALPAQFDAIVVMGLAAGYHIRYLVDRYIVKHIIIYEPEEQYLKCTVYMQSWMEVLKTAQQKGIGLYFQLGKDGRGVSKDLRELQVHARIEHCFFFKHYNHSVFDAILIKLRQHGLAGLDDLPVAALQDEKREDIVPRWSAPIDLSNWQSEWLSEQRFNDNLVAFKRFFPNIYDEFVDYTPSSWEPFANQQGEVNICHRHKKVNLYGESPVEDCHKSLNSFASYPHKDGLVLGYKGQKLRKFLHYQMVKKIEPILEQLEDEQGELPSTIKSMIIFGLGVGYQLQELVEHYVVEKLFICEPNRDYFYASLFALDWRKILESIDKNGGRLYINIGDDGTHLFEDLIIQFQTVGPYVLANTYFYQSYYNEKLVASIAQLREQLQVLIAMGDYFDHSRHVLAHTKKAIQRGIPHLLKSPGQYLSVANKGVPVFVVGNGPSLDNLIDLVKEHQHTAIVISCGTALQTLHRHGIVPDFHAEIEANRSTFDWAVRVGEFDYLKKITLISCNGIHPDTCELYGEVLLAFKQGESATVSIQEVYKKSFPFAQMAFAYPTVTNFVADFLGQFEFEQVYLVGVDMGFVDDKYHHSKSSGYYWDDGQERFNYRKTSNTKMVVPGNFRSLVNTKHEFKIAKQVLEQPLTKCGDVYNLNDGALIKGAMPLQKEDVLILSSKDDKNLCINAMKNKAFYCLDAEEFEQRFSSYYRHDFLLDGLKQLLHLTEQEFNTIEDADNFIEQQRGVLVASLLVNRSLLFFYLNGSLNFVNSALTKITAIDEDTVALDYFCQVVDSWRFALKDILESMRIEPLAFDSISTLSYARGKVMFPWFMQTNNITIGSHDQLLCELLPQAFSCYGLQDKTSPVSEAGVYLTRSLSTAEQYAFTKAKVIYIHTDRNINSGITNSSGGFISIYLPNYYNDPLKPAHCNIFYACIIAMLTSTLTPESGIVLPKLHLDDSCQSLHDIFDLSFIEGYYVYDYPFFLFLTPNALSEEQKSTGPGDRGRFIPYFDTQLLALTPMDITAQREVRDSLPQVLRENKYD